MVEGTAGPRWSEETAAAALGSVRAACLALPRTSERLSHGSPAFFVGPRCFAMSQVDHHGDGRLALWCAAPPGVQAELVELEPDRFFRPPYVGHRGWLGVLLDRLAPEELGPLVHEAWACVAPAAARREEEAAGGSGGR